MVNIYDILSGLHQSDLKLNTKIDNRVTTINESINTITTGYLSGFNASGSLKSSIDDIVADIQAINDKIGDTGESLPSLNEQVATNKTNITTLSSALAGYTDANAVSSKFVSVDAAITKAVSDSDIEISSNTQDSEYAAVYTITQGGQTVGTINIPKDQFVKNVSYDNENKQLIFSYELDGKKQNVTVPISDLVAGLASETYVDGKAADAVLSANNYTDAKIEELKISDYAKITYVDGKVGDINGNITYISGVLSGYTAEGSVKTAVDAAQSTADQAVANAATAQTAAENAMAETQKKVNAEPGKELASTTDIEKWNATSTKVDGFGDIVTHNASEFDEVGAAAAVLGSDSDAAGAATVFGANKAAAAAQADATSALTKIGDGNLDELHNTITAFNGTI